MILVMFATEPEAAPFMKCAAWERENIGRKPVFRSAAGGTEVLISGMGQVNTAQALAAYLEGRTRPEIVILGGIAGAFAGMGAAAGDVCFAAEEIYADTGIHSPEGFMGIEKTGIPLAEAEDVKYYNRFPVRDLSPEIAGSRFPFKIYSGPFATVSAVSGTKKAAAWIKETWNPLCENMEGAAAAHVSLMYGVPFAEVRGISNMVEERNRARWDIPKACANCAAVIRKLMEKI